MLRLALLHCRLPSSYAIYSYNARCVAFRYQLPYLSTASYSTGGKGFLSGIVDKMKDEYRKDKELKENLAKFQEERQKLEKSDEIQKMREYYKKLEDNVSKDATDKLKGTLETLRKRMLEQEYLQKAAKHVSSTAEVFSEQVSKSAEKLSDSELLKKAVMGAQFVEEQIEGENAMRVYCRPAVLLTRDELAGITSSAAAKVVDPNMDEQRVVLHKDSKWSEAWSNFRDTNPYVQKFFDMKTQYDESENPMIRGTRFLTERVGSLFGGMLSDNEYQQVMDEIVKLDPSFSSQDFVIFCRQHIIPHVLEAMIQGDLKVLESWCHEAPFAILSQPLKNAQSLGCHQDSTILDISLPEISMAKMMEHGPVLVISFNAQQINAVRDRQGKVVEGDANKIVRMTHVWALCRDQTELNSKSAWRVLEVAMLPMTQWL